MALVKQKRVKYVHIDMDTGNLKAVVLIDIIDSDTQEIEGSKARTVKCKNGDETKALKLGIKNLTDVLWA